MGKKQPRPQNFRKPGLFTNLETGKKSVVSVTETTGKDGKRVTTVKKTKPGNSNN